MVVLLGLCNKDWSSETDKEGIWAYTMREACEKIKGSKVSDITQSLSIVRKTKQAN